MVVVERSERLGGVLETVCLERVRASEGERRRRR